MRRVKDDARVLAWATNRVVGGMVFTDIENNVEGIIL